VLTVFEYSSQQFFIFDSKEEFTYQHQDLLETTLRGFYEKLNDALQEPTKDFKIVKKRTTQQIDYCSCGVFVIL